MPKKTKPPHDRRVAANAAAAQRDGSRGEPKSTVPRRPAVGSETSPSGRKRSGTAKPRPESNQSHLPANFPVVGIGASAGGLEALQALFGAMPVDTGMAFVVMTHQHPGHTSLLPELLSRSTKVPVVEATDGIQLVPNQIFVATPGAQLAVLNGVLHRMESSTSESPKLPIDYFFQSLAADLRERAIGIILSGTGGDGSIGLRAIKEESGMVMVEEPRSAKYAGMPASAIATGLADYVLAPESMPPKLLSYIRGPFIHEAPFVEERPVPNEPLQKILILLRNRTSHDFSAYKINTLRRRIERRMNVHQILEHSAYV
ncbi:MAG: chemotaxis protein CheR, partial [Planctomycetota bacterium]|nr:chemotaxis protein CheR [Planctomycetota bacterium]